jgi:F-type H+-transporting ATPase subunit delta
MSDARIEAYSRALFEVAQAEGNLSVVEDELFRMARAVESSEQLRGILTDATIPAERRQQVVEQLLGGKTSNTSVFWSWARLASNRRSSRSARIKRTTARSCRSSKCSCIV